MAQPGLSWELIVRLDVDTWLGVLLILGAALLLILTAASSAAGFFAGRRSPRLLAGRNATRPDQMQQFVHERERLLASLVLARTVCIVTASITAATLVMHRVGGSGRAALAVGLVTVAAAGVLEGVPRVVISRNPDRWTDLVTPVTTLLQGVFFLPAYLADLPGKALLRLPRFHPKPEQDEQDEEIVRLVEMEESQGGIEEEERQMIRAVFELEETSAREIMVPRIDMTALEVHSTLQDVARLIAERGYSRIPAYESSIDNIVGVVYAKDVLAEYARGGAPIDLRTIARPPVFVPESKRVAELLTELRDQRIHMAIVVDEYGGTSGLLTIEDLVEEIVGEIEDEYDHTEPTVVRTEDGDVLVDARERVDVLKELFDVDVESGDFDTVGGFVIHRLGRIPAVNDTVDVNGIRLQVLSVTGRRVRKVRITRLEAIPATEAGG